MEFVIGIILICLVGTLLHFTYELSHHNKYVAIFSAVNESTWEHIKIGMTPTLIWSIYEISVYSFSLSFILAKSLCLLTIILLIPQSCTLLINILLTLSNGTFLII